MNSQELINQIVSFPFESNAAQLEARDSFLRKFPESRIASLSDQEYNGGKNKDSFCYNLEFVPALPFGIGGRSDKKFGKKSESKQVVQGIAHMIRDARKGNISGIQGRCGLSGVYQDVLIKILSIYLPDKFITVGHEFTLTLLGRILGISCTPDDRIELNFRCNEKLREILPSSFDYDYNRLGSAIWRILSPATRSGYDKWLKSSKPRVRQKKDKSKGGSSTSSYPNCIEYLSYYYKENYFSDQVSKTVLNNLYQEALAHQKEDNGKFYFPKPSYGSAMFYSAAVNALSEYMESFGLFKGSVIQNQINPNRRTYPHNIILYGPPGTGKTYNTIRYAVAIVNGYDAKTITNNESVIDGKSIKEHFDEYFEKGQIRFTTFHQSLSYEDFIEGIKPEYDEENGVMKYPVKPGIFKEICMEAAKKENKDKRFVLIIDEINRGNVAQIFGELISLIEEDKREGEKNALSVILPYSPTGKNKFSVPSNLYILGTMNTADRSIEALDTALRRRFKFIEMMPNIEIVPESIDNSTISPRGVLEKINKRISVLKDSEHQIGHSYLMKVNNVEELMDVFRHNILPLLWEYFYGDTDRIKMVVGEKFFKESESTKSLFPKDTDVDYPESISSLWEETEWEECEKDPSHTRFVAAIEALMK